MIADNISAPTDKLLKQNHAESLFAHSNSSISDDDLPLLLFNKVQSKTDVALAKPLKPNRRPRRVLRSEAHWQSDTKSDAGARHDETKTAKHDAEPATKEAKKSEDKDKIARVIEWFETFSERKLQSSGTKVWRNYMKDLGEMWTS